MDAGAKEDSRGRASQTHRGKRELALSQFHRQSPRETRHFSPAQSDKDGHEQLRTLRKRRIERDQRAVSVSLNTREPRSGARSLLLEWSGDPQPMIPVVSQLILVEAGRRYRLSFWTRSEELVTGESPIVTISAHGEIERLFALGNQ